MQSSFLTKVITIITVGLVSIVVLISFYWHHSMTRIVTEAAITNAKETINQFKILRGYYTKYVVTKVKGQTGLRIDSDHKRKKNTIPLPATMIHDLSSLIGRDDDSSLILKLYSEFPFPNRKNRVLDSFAENALRELKKNPDQVFIQEGNIAGNPYVRVAIADRLVAQSCVDCHNGRPDTPKSDWKLNDVRGVLEADIPLQVYKNNTQEAIINGVMVFCFLSFVVMGLLFLSIRKITSPVEAVISKIASGSKQTLTTSQDVTNVSRTLTSSASSQASSIEETSSSMEEIASMATTNANYAAEASNIVEEARSVVGESSKNVEEMSKSMGEITVSFAEVSKIAHSIQSIAFQTRVLALNATLEAAAAGEVGSRFSVVAEEVHFLSNNTREEAKKTVDLIQSIHKSIDVGNEVFNHVKESFDDIEQSTLKIVSLVEEIRAASKEQAQGCQQINKTLVNLDHITQSNSMQSDQVSSIAEELTSQSKLMDDAVQSLSSVFYGTKRRKE